MGYVVYVNHPNNKAIVHKTSCGKYVNRRRDKTHNGYWSKIFTSREDAIYYAKNRRKKTWDTCAFCMTEQKIPESKLKLSPLEGWLWILMIFLLFLGLIFGLFSLL